MDGVSLLPISLGRPVSAALDHGRPGLGWPILATLRPMGGQSNCPWLKGYRIRQP